MTFLGLFALALSLFIQAADVPSIAVDIFSPKERARMQRADSIGRRIKVYHDASKRIQQTLRDAISKERFAEVPDHLKLWTLLLAKSLEDIEANLKSKKKSKDLIKYEIQVRKAIADTQNLKTLAPVDQQDAFDSCIDQAETIRKRFVDILFKQSA